MVALGVPLAVSMRDRVEAEVRSQARSQADVVAASASEPLEHHRSGTLGRLAGASARASRGRVIIVGAGGHILADSAGPASKGDDYSGRPEITAALGGQSYQQTRHSDTLGEDILATAVPVLRAGNVVGAARVTQSVAAVDGAVRRSLAGIAILGLVVIGLGLAAGALIAQRIARPIGRLAGAADSVTAGELATRAAVEGSSEQRSLAISFNEMTERLERLIVSQQEFVADASHQLRTPLTGLRLELEELQDLGAGPEREAAVASALHEVDRLSAIVDELLLLSRAGAAATPAEPVDLADAADRAAGRWRSAATAAGLSIERRSEPGAGGIRCVPGDLDRALDAVIENAVAYGAAGRRVVVADDERGIEILDEGPGFEPGEEAAVFDRFFRGSAGRRGPQGTGLGLPIARELAAGWGGGVEARNRDGGGATVRLTFPSRAQVAK